MSKEAVYEFVTRVDSDPEIGRALRGTAGVDAIVRVASERGFAFTPAELTPVLDLLRFLDNARRDVWLRGALASAPDHEAVVALGGGAATRFRPTSSPIWSWRPHPGSSPSATWTASSAA